MPDWDATLFWRDAQSQNVIDENTLPISEALKRDLNSYYAWYSELFFSDGEPKASLVDMRLLDARGFEIWLRLRHELIATHRVLFYSHEFNDSFDLPEDFTKVREQTLG
jgi:hypothetical protein